jgi:hypothetical protein
MIKLFKEHDWRSTSRISRTKELGTMMPDDMGGLLFGVDVES